MSASLSAPFSFFGGLILDILTSFGRLAIFLRGFLRELVPGLRYLRLIMAQARFIGAGRFRSSSSPRSSWAAWPPCRAPISSRGGAARLSWAPFIAKSVFIELGPVLTALVVGARVGSSFAAEIGTMRVTEQVDALETLAIRPMRYLAVPRLVAALIMLPVITVFANAIALIGGMTVAVTRVGISIHTFTRGHEDPV